MWWGSRFLGAPWNIFVSWLGGIESACNAGDPGLIPGVKKTLWEEEMAPHSSILAWDIPCTEEPGLCGFCKESDTTEWLKLTLKMRGSPGSPVVDTLWYQSPSRGSAPGWETGIPCASWCSLQQKRWADGDKERLRNFLEAVGQQNEERKWTRFQSFGRVSGFGASLRRQSRWVGLSETGCLQGPFWLSSGCQTRNGLALCVVLSYLVRSDVEESEVVGRHCLSLEALTSATGPRSRRDGPRLSRMFWNRSQSGLVPLSDGLGSSLGHSISCRFPKSPERHWLWVSSSLPSGHLLGGSLWLWRLPTWEFPDSFLRWHWGLRTHPAMQET